MRVHCITGSVTSLIFPVAHSSRLPYGMHCAAAAVLCCPSSTRRTAPPQTPRETWGSDTRRAGRASEGNQATSASKLSPCRAASVWEWEKISTPSAGLRGPAGREWIPTSTYEYSSYVRSTRAQKQRCHPSGEAAPDAVVIGRAPGWRLLSGLGAARRSGYSYDTTFAH